MMLASLLGIAPIACAVRTVRRVDRWLGRSFRHWRAKQREHLYLGSLNEYEADRLAKDIGLSRTELLGDQRRPTSRNLAPLPSAAGSRPQIGCKARPMHLTDI